MCICIDTTPELTDRQTEFIWIPPEGEASLELKVPP